MRALSCSAACVPAARCGPFRPRSRAAALHGVAARPLEPTGRHAGGTAQRSPPLQRFSIICPARSANGNQDGEELPLIEAVKVGDVERLKRGIAAGADLDARDPHGRGSAVTYAAILGKEDCLQVLLEAGADPEARMDFIGISISPLYAAVRFHPSCVRLLLRHGADANSAVCSEGEGEGTPLLVAAMEGHLECLEALLEHGADVEQATSYNQTALYFAALHGHTGCVQALVKAGASIERAADNGDTALICAAKSGSAECLEFLINAGANLEAGTDNGSTSVMVAAGAGHTACVKALLRAGARADATNESGTSACVFACKAGSVECLEALLDAGADPNVLGDPDVLGGGWTALYVAATGGHLACVQLLLARGAEPATVVADGRDALTAAARNGHEGIVRALLQAGAPTESWQNAALASAVAAAQPTRPRNALVGAFGLGGKPPPTAALYEAAGAGHVGCVQALLEAGADTEVCCSTFAVTPLILAAMLKQTEVVKLLLKAGANTEARTINGQTALCSAKRAGDTEIVRLLRAAGAVDSDDEDGSS